MFYWTPAFGPGGFCLRCPFLFCDCESRGNNVATCIYVRVSGMATDCAAKVHLASALLGSSASTLWAGLVCELWACCNDKSSGEFGIQG